MTRVLRSAPFFAPAFFALAVYLLPALAIAMADNQPASNLGAQPVGVDATENSEPLGSSSNAARLPSDLEGTFRRADEQFQAGNYAQAGRLFTQVWHLSQASEHQGRWGRYTAIFAFNAATSYRLAHDCTAAHQAFADYTRAFDALPAQQQRALRDATDLPADNGAWLAELNEECPSLPTSAQPLTTTTATIGVNPTGNWLLAVNLTPTPMEKNRAVPPADAPTIAQTRLGWLLTAGGVASLAVAGYFLWSGLDNNRNATDPATKHQPFQDYTGRRDRDYITAGVVGVLGLGLTGGGIYVLTAAAKPVTASHATMEPKLWLFASGTHFGLGGEL